MPVKFINTPYYNLVNTILLDPISIYKNTREIYGRYLTYVENPDFINFNLMPISVHKTQYCGSNRVDFKKAWDRLDKRIILNKLHDHIQSLWEDGIIDKIHTEYKLLTKLVNNNTYKIYDMLSSAMCDAYFNKYIVTSVSRAIAIRKIKRKIPILYYNTYIKPVITKIAINKIKRNAIYNHGLGLKLAIREYSKDF